jgi:hypothetical protein
MAGAALEGRPHARRGVGRLDQRRLIEEWRGGL